MLSSSLTKLHASCYASASWLRTVGPPRLIRTTLTSFADWCLGYSVIGGKLARGRRVKHLSSGLEPEAQSIYQPRILLLVILSPQAGAVDSSMKTAHSPAAAPYALHLRFASSMRYRIVGLSSRWLVVGITWTQSGVYPVKWCRLVESNHPKAPYESAPIAALANRHWCAMVWIIPTELRRFHRTSISSMQLECLYTASKKAFWCSSWTTYSGAKKKN